MSSNIEEDIYTAVGKALGEHDSTIKDLSERISVLKDELKAGDLKVNQLIGQIADRNAYAVRMELGLRKEQEERLSAVEKLTSVNKVAAKEMEEEIAHWRRENERLIDERNKISVSLEKEITARDTDIQSLIADQSKLVQKHEESLEQMRIRYEASAAHDANVIKTLYTERQSVQDLYQEERALVKKAWEVLGYNASSGMPPKSLEELIRDKDVEIATLQKSRETATFEHADHAAALRTEIDRLNARQEIMEVTIARYKGLQDQSDLLLRCADAMEREQYSGSGADIPELIAEVKKKVVSVQ